MQIGDKNLMFNQDNILYLINLSNLTTSLLDNVWINYGEKLHVNYLWEFSIKNKK